MGAKTVNAKPLEKAQQSLGNIIIIQRNDRHHSINPAEHLE